MLAPVQPALAQTTLPDATAPRKTPAPSRSGSRWAIAGASVLLGVLTLIAGFSVLTNRTPEWPSVEIHDEQQEEGSAKDRMTDLATEFAARWNKHRKAAGLGAVALDAELSEGCMAHAKYLARNLAPGEATLATAYIENPGMPAFSAAGRETAAVALVSYAKPTHALERWMGRLFGRAQMLCPELQTVGFGFAQSASGDWVCVVDPVHGKGAARAERAQVVVYPAPDQSEVPTPGFDRIAEADNGPVGFPISVYFPQATVLQFVEATLTDAASKPVAMRISSPAQPLSANLQRASIGLHPLRPLHPSCTYTVEVAARADGAPWRQRWQFTTGK